MAPPFLCRRKQSESLERAGWDFSLIVFTYTHTHRGKGEGSKGKRKIPERWWNYEVESGSGGGGTDGREERAGRDVGWFKAPECVLKCIIIAVRIQDRDGMFF